MILSGIDQLWVADLTYVHMEEEFAYLAIVLDAHSRRVVGWALETHLQASLATAALDMAIRTRRPAPGSLIHHSDRGVQGGFKRSSQQLYEGGCDEEAEAAIGSIRAGSSAVTWPAPLGSA
jgi:transposase InsO family protein